MLLVGATNRPQELDEAARRRLVKKVNYYYIIFLIFYLFFYLFAFVIFLVLLFNIYLKVYIPLPDLEARMELIKNLLKKQANSLTEAEVLKVSEQTHGYSGSDLFALCSEAALNPVRALSGQVFFSFFPFNFFF